MILLHFRDNDLPNISNDDDMILSILNITLMTLCFSFTQKALYHWRQYCSYLSMIISFGAFPTKCSPQIVIHLKYTWAIFLYSPRNFCRRNYVRDMTLILLVRDNNPSSISIMVWYCSLWILWYYLLGTTTLQISPRWYDNVHFGHNIHGFCFWFHPKGDLI